MGVLFCSVVNSFDVITFQETSLCLLGKDDLAIFLPYH